MERAKYLTGIFFSVFEASAQLRVNDAVFTFRPVGIGALLLSPNGQVKFHQLAARVAAVANCSPTYKFPKPGVIRTVI
jgi:hypothetical protein